MTLGNLLILSIRRSNGKLIMASHREGTIAFSAAFRTANEESFFPVFTQMKININWTLSTKETPTSSFSLPPLSHPAISSVSMLGGKMSPPIVPKQISGQESDLSFMKSNQLAWSWQLFPKCSWETDLWQSVKFGTKSYYCTSAGNKEADSDLTKQTPCGPECIC